MGEKNYKRKVDVLNWFNRQGYELYEGDKFGEGEDYTGQAYYFVNNIDAYTDFMASIKREEPLPTGSYSTEEESEIFEQFLDERTRIEIGNDGNIHIVY
ncbi:hypothetical protein [Paenibacillus agaridevorans]|uniref:hypothetical protein n=1 Tax=Paenibacillus agaridevorans TaxID=171404 RepID=UPI001BE3F5FE|nr:hypothetical protein [Paenibacillus agaridevorans]